MSTTSSSDVAQPQRVISPKPCWSSQHVQWLVDTGERMKTADGKTIEIWEFRHTKEDGILSEWARHFRNHYCLESDIDFLRGNRTRKDYLEEIKFPSPTSKLGPSVRAGDFGEILVADYLQWVLGYSVPRVRWSGKVIRDESPKGSDVIGFKFDGGNGISSDDSLAVFESKTAFSGNKWANRLQDAINDSAKDRIRIDESLNYIKQKLFDKGEKVEAEKVERFQNPVDLPYREIYGAVALYSHNQFTASEICKADTQKTPMSSKKTGFRPHPKGDRLVLIIIKGADMMTLVHELYRRAADEA